MQDYSPETSLYRQEASSFGFAEKTSSSALKREVLLKKSSILESAAEFSILQGYDNTCHPQIESNRTQNVVEPISWDSAGKQQFQNIAPHLTKIDTYTNSIASIRAPSTELQPTGAGTTILFNSNFTTLYDNFYLSDVITKSSITTGKCATQSRNNGNFF